MSQTLVEQLFSILKFDFYDVNWFSIGGISCWIKGQIPICNLVLSSQKIIKLISILFNSLSIHFIKSLTEYSVSNYNHLHLYLANPYIFNKKSITKLTFYFQWRPLPDSFWSIYREPKLNTWRVICCSFTNIFDSSHT